MSPLAIETTGWVLGGSYESWSYKIPNKSYSEVDQSLSMLVS